MKFAQYMAALERDAPRHWQGKFITYKRLKKLLKQMVDSEGKVMVEVEDAFFREIEAQLTSINGHFHSEAERTIAAFHRLQMYGYMRRIMQRLHFWRITPRSEEAVAERAYWCRKYVRINAVALRKILKKHDKICGNSRGREFLCECWRTSISDTNGFFLHSPLVDEVKAIQDILQRKSDQDHSTHGGQRHTEEPTESDSHTEEYLAFSRSSLEGDLSASTVLQSVKYASTWDTTVCCTEKSKGVDPDAPWTTNIQARERTLLASGFGPFQEGELRCPICLDVMYKPVALSCGHKFCKPCVLQAAGYGHLIGTFENVVSYIPRRTPCPECRQPHVFRGARSLKEVGSLIRSRYPKRWEQRRAEAREDRAIVFEPRSDQLNTSTDILNWFRRTNLFDIYPPPTNHLLETR